jgi:hypothetical protein
MSPLRRDDILTTWGMLFQMYKSIFYFSGQTASSQLLRARPIRVRRPGCECPLACGKGFSNLLLDALWDGYFGQNTTVGAVEPYPNFPILSFTSSRYSAHSIFKIVCHITTSRWQYRARCVARKSAGSRPSALPIVRAIPMPVRWRAPAPASMHPG